MNLDGAYTVEDLLNSDFPDKEFLSQKFEEAKSFLARFTWHDGFRSAYAGMCYDGILCVFLFDLDLTINKEFEDDNFVWVIVGDIPPAFITSEDAPNAACALDGYVGAMWDWVDAALAGNSVEGLIPVNVSPTIEHAKMLKSRLEFIDKVILSDVKYKSDLKA